LSLVDRLRTYEAAEGSAFGFKGGRSSPRPPPPASPRRYLQCCVVRWSVGTVVNPGPGDTLLIGGAGGGVGVFAVQLARLAGARVIGTGSATSADALHALGAEPVAYGDGLVDRVRDLAPAGVTAAIDLYGTETAQAAARELSVPDERITTVAAQVDGITPANGANAAPGAIEEIARLVAAGQLRVPIAASFPVEQIRAAVKRQAGRHVHGKVVIDL
jgi:NADPH:quinone reductase-like Zn-dependent oxidoreductase